MSNDAYVQRHYQKVAQHFGLSPLSSLQDPFLRQAEWQYLRRSLEHLLGAETSFLGLDLGAGNGATLEYLAPHFPRAQFIGIERSPDLWALSLERLQLNPRLGKQVAYCLGDAREPLDFGPFDVIYTERTIINLLSPKQQRLAFERIAQALKPGGYYLLLESFKAPLERLNRARAEVGKPPISISPHNRYLGGNTIHRLSRLGLIPQEGVQPPHVLSTHFFSARVLHELWRPPGGKHKLSAIVDFLDQALPPGIGDYAPLKFYTFIKIATPRTYHA